VKLTKTLSDGLEFERLAVTPTANSGILDIQTNPLATERTWMLGNLRAGQKRVIEFRVMPKKTGQFNVKTSLVAAGSVKEEKVGKWSILEPKLGLKITGPETAYVGQPATYQVAVNNLGTATLNNVRVSVPIPQASETVRMSNEGQVFRDQVQWIVAKLEPGDSRTLSVTFKTPRPGPRRISATVRADRGLEQRAEIETRIEGVAALNWKTEGTPATTKAGMDIVYTIRVTNTGSAPATNVVVKGEYPVSVEYRAAQPQASLGKGIVSYPAQTIPAGQTATYTLTVTAVKADQARFVFTLFADHLDKNNPIRSEPTTTISGP